MFLYKDPTTVKYNEIDMEYAKWNDSATPGASYTVWPALQHAPPSPDCPRADQRPQIDASNLGHGLVSDITSGVTEPLHCTHDFQPNFTSNLSTHRITWNSRNVSFETLDDLANGTQLSVSSYAFAPHLPKVFIPQAPMSVRLNLYVLDGGPLDDREVEVVVHGVEVPSN